MLTVKGSKQLKACYVDEGIIVIMETDIISAFSIVLVDFLFFGALLPSRQIFPSWGWRKSIING